MKIISSVNYSEFKSLLGEAKRLSDPICARYFFRPLSFPTGWLFYRLGVKANYISLLSIFLAIISSFIIVLGDPDDLVTASFMMIFVALLDCIDGNVARARGETGPSGEWMDALSGYTVYALLPLSLGIHLSIHNPYQQIPGIWIILGALTSIANLFLRLLYQKYLSGIPDQSSQKGLKGSGSIFSRFSSEMGLIGWMMPALLLASVINKLDIYLGLYCFFYVTSAIIITILLARRGT